MITLDGTVVNVAIPTMLHDFRTTLPTIQWVVTGYTLTFATLLVIGGRLGDIYGHRLVFSVGVWLFFAGSFLAVVSWSVGSLIVGEAVIEEIGSSLMMPATLAIISIRFEGAERRARLCDLGWCRGGRRRRSDRSSAESSRASSLGAGRSESICCTRRPRRLVSASPCVRTVEEGNASSWTSSAPRSSLVACSSWCSRSPRVARTDGSRR